MPVNTEQTEQSGQLEKEIWIARQEIEEAEHHLFYADPDFILSAKLKLQSARSRLNSLIKRRKGEQDDGCNTNSIDDGNYLNADWIDSSVDTIHRS